MLNSKPNPLPLGLANPFVLAGLLLAVLSGCANVPPSNPALPKLTEKLTVPSSLPTGVNAAQASAQVDYLQWWKAWQDPVLNQLLEEAAQNNQDLVLAAARIDEARATLAGSRAGLYPTLDLAGTAVRNRTSENAGKLGPGSNPINRDFQLGLNAAYEIDFWGKFSQADAAARARLLAQQANRGMVQSSLFANVAASYFTLRAQDAQLQLVQSSFKTRQENLRLQQKRLAAGSIGQLDFHLAESEAAASEIAQAQAVQALSNTGAALAQLLGRSPAQIVQPVLARGSDIGKLYQQLRLPAELPSDLLVRRPDIIAAEQALSAANADVAQARAAYFPTIRLATSLGYESRVFGDLFNPASLLWNLGSSLAQPLFRGGSIDAAVAGSEARRAQATGQYVQSVQGAFREVHDALTNSNAGAQVVLAGQRRVAALQESLRLADLRYQNGYSGYLEVLSAQRDLFQAQTALIENQRAHLAAVVALYKAVGGGWGK
jgi:outer membrane protein, multidrug efflux system